MQRAAGLLVFLGSIARAQAQEEAELDEPAKMVTEQTQVWLAYMTQTRFSDSFSWWNDFHFVPKGFLVLRTGLTYHPHQRVALTAGYGYLGLPVRSGEADLSRSEHRPWAQALFTNPIDESWSTLQRVRYESRFRQKVEDGETVSGYDFNHRIRFMFQVRRDFKEWAWGESNSFVPYAVLADEVLLNFGEQIIYNHLDQNRVTAGIGVAHGGLSFQVGYMNRYSQLPAGDQFVMNHTMLFWVFHNIDLRSSD